jgi:hypothetical protein
MRLASSGPPPSVASLAVTDNQGRNTKVLLQMPSNKFRQIPRQIYLTLIFNRLNKLGGDRVKNSDTPLQDEIYED